MGGNYQRTDFVKSVVLYVLGLGVFLYVFYQNAWIHEDAFITFRSVEQVFAGHGPVWNPHERVQVYTHPLWFIGLLCFRVFTTDLFLSAILFSIVCWLAILFLWARLLKSPWKWALTILCLVSTKCIMDFSTSGLEGPLASCLAGLLVMALIQRRSPYHILMVSSFLILCRHDLLLLAFPAIIWALVVEWKQSGLVGTFRAGLTGFSPLLAWTLFSVIYYGFPFPNSAYAKLGTGLPLFPTASDSGLFFRGIRYLVASSSMDPMIPITLSLAVGLMAARSKTYRWPYFIALLGIVLYGLYIIRVGGDYMAGRFCVVPVWTALLIVIHGADGRWKYSVVVVLALLVIIFNPASPLKATPHAPLPSTRAGGIGDERAGYIEATALHQYLVAGDPAYLFRSAVTRKWYLSSGG